jgi:predicted AAA+ superfamily ATPase
MRKSRSKTRSTAKRAKGRNPDRALADGDSTRIAAALERLAPPAPSAPDFSAADAFSWHPEGGRLIPVKRVNRVAMALLKGIDRVRDLLLENTERFARGLPANNALLWGARGMGKSSLVKAVHAEVGSALDGRQGRLRLVEIHREDIESLPDLMAATIFRSRRRTHPTSRSRRCSKAASRAGPTT